MNPTNKGLKAWQIALLAILAVHIVDDAIQSRHISAGAIDESAMVADGIITEAKLSGALQSKINAALPYVRTNRAPSQTDDSANTAGATYLEGTGAALRAKWVDDSDPANPQMYECIDATVGNAVWVDVTNIEADDLSDLAFIDKATLQDTINITASRVSNFNAAVQAAVQASDNTFTGTNTFQNVTTFEAAVNGTSATFTGSVSAGSATLTGLLTGTDAQFSGGVDVTGNISAGGSITGGAFTGSSFTIAGDSFDEILKAADYSTSNAAGTSGSYKVDDNDDNAVVTKGFLKAMLNSTAFHSVRRDSKLVTARFRVETTGATRLNVPYYGSGLVLYFRNGILISGDLDDDGVTGGSETGDGSAYIEFTNAPLAEGEVLTAWVVYQPYGVYEIGGA